MPPDRTARPLPRPEHVRPIALSELATQTGAVRDGADVAVTGISVSSQQIRSGDLFAGLPGHTSHGAGFAAEAIANGAVAVLTDEAGRELVPPGVALLTVDDVRAHLAAISAAVYGWPSAGLTTAGVTGTSGKTTTTFLVRAGLRAAGRRSGLIGTVATMIDDAIVQTGLTTPEAPDVQALLAVMRERGVGYVAMEVSSHALVLGRADAVDFDVAAFTNLSQDHLDFHADMEDYFAAKATLFDGRARMSLVMVDDEWGRRLAERVGAAAVTISTTGDASAHWQAHDVATSADGRTTFEVRAPDGSTFSAGCAIPGRYNVANALLAVAILDEFGVGPRVAAPAVAAATVPGRMERIDAGQVFLAIVDYSHKPAAVRGALTALRPLTSGRLIVVLGCGGDRDRAKRPAMGEIAARGADLLIITDDNPRTEQPAEIRAAMLAGVDLVAPSERGEVREIGDRARAIEAAVACAVAGDSVLIAGKGHEQGQEINGRVIPFDDREVLRNAIAGVSG